MMSGSTLFQLETQSGATKASPLDPVTVLRSLSEASYSKPSKIGPLCLGASCEAKIGPVVTRSETMVVPGSWRFHAPHTYVRMHTAGSGVRRTRCESARRSRAQKRAIIILVFVVLVIFSLSGYKTRL